MEPFTLIEIFASGKTRPEVESETEILLIQDGEVMVGAICYDDDDQATLYIDHPINEKELSKEALKLVQEKFPDYLKTEQSIVLSCPADIATQMRW